MSLRHPLFFLSREINCTRSFFSYSSRELYHFYYIFSESVPSPRKKGVVLCLYVLVCISALQCVAVHCSVLQCVAAPLIRTFSTNVPFPTREDRQTLCFVPTCECVYSKMQWMQWMPFLKMHSSHSLHAMNAFWEKAFIAFKCLFSKGIHCNHRIHCILRKMHSLQMHSLQKAVKAFSQNAMDAFFLSWNEYRRSVSLSWSKMLSLFRNLIFPLFENEIISQIFRNIVFSFSWDEMCAFSVSRGMNAFSLPRKMNCACSFPLACNEGYHFHLIFSEIVCTFVENEVQCHRYPSFKIKFWMRYICFSFGTGTLHSNFDFECTEFDFECTKFDFECSLPVRLFLFRENSTCSERIVPVLWYLFGKCTVPMEEAHTKMNCEWSVENEWRVKQFWMKDAVYPFACMFSQWKVFFPWCFLWRILGEWSVENSRRVNEECFTLHSFSWMIPGKKETLFMHSREWFSEKKETLLIHSCEWFFSKNHSREWRVHSREWRVHSMNEEWNNCEWTIQCTVRLYVFPVQSIFSVVLFRKVYLFYEREAVFYAYLLQGAAVCCSVLQCVAVCCSTNWLHLFHYCTISASLLWQRYNFRKLTIQDQACSNNVIIEYMYMHSRTGNISQVHANNLRKSI